MRLLRDPTLAAPPSYQLHSRAREVYGGAFLRAFEYLKVNEIQGDVMEFGTFRGYTSRVIVTTMRRLRYPGKFTTFDSFQGLPELATEIDSNSYEVAINRTWVPGTMVAGAVDRDIERVLRRVWPETQVVKGFFENSLPLNLPQNKLALVHLDCDFYESAKFVLRMLLAKDRIEDGAILMFDDWNSNRARPDMGERRAVAEILMEHQVWITPFFSYGHGGQALFLNHKRIEIAPTSSSTSEASR